MIKSRQGTTKRPKKIGPWTNVSSSDLQQKIDVGLSELHDTGDEVSIESAQSNTNLCVSLYPSGAVSACSRSGDDGSPPSCGHVHGLLPSWIMPRPLTPITMPCVW